MDGSTIKKILAAAVVLVLLLLYNIYPLFLPSEHLTLDDTKEVSCITFFLTDDMDAFVRKQTIDDYMAFLKRLDVAEVGQPPLSLGFGGKTECYISYTDESPDDVIIYKNGILQVYNKENPGNSRYYAVKSIDSLLLKKDPFRAYIMSFREKMEKEFQEIQ